MTPNLSLPLPNTFFSHISPICRIGPLQLFPAVCTKLTKAVVWSLSVHCPGIEFCSECLTTVWNLVLSDWLFSIKLSSWIWWLLLLGTSCLKAFRSVEPSSSWHWPESSLSVPGFWVFFICYLRSQPYIHFSSPNVFTFCSCLCFAVS